VQSGRAPPHKPALEGAPPGSASMWVNRTRCCGSRLARRIAPAAGGGEQDNMKTELSGILSQASLLPKRGGPSSVILGFPTRTSFFASTFRPKATGNFLNVAADNAKRFRVGTCHGFAIFAEFIAEHDRRREKTRLQIMPPRTPARKTRHSTSKDDEGAMILPAVRQGCGTGGTRFSALSGTANRNIFDSSRIAASSTANTARRPRSADIPWDKVSDIGASPGNAASQILSSMREFQNTFRMRRPVALLQIRFPHPMPMRVPRPGGSKTISMYRIGLNWAQALNV